MHTISVCIHTVTLPPLSRTDPCPFLEPPGARPGVGLLGMVPGSLRSSPGRCSRKQTGIVPWVSCVGVKFLAAGQLCDSCRVGPTWRCMAAALLWDWLHKGMEGVPGSVVLSSKMAASWPALCVGYWLRDI